MSAGGVSRAAGLEAPGRRWFHAPRPRRRARVAARATCVRTRNATGLAAVAALALAVAAGVVARAAPPPGPFGDAIVGPPLQDGIRQVHDPSMIRQGDTWYVFSTGAGISIHCGSADLLAWKLCGRVWFKPPDWFRQAVPGVHDVWAPDISYFGGLYHLYYAISTFGSNTSAIGLATSPTLDPEAADHGWTDRGQVLATHGTEDYNAIDPNLVLDEHGDPWLAFGSYWSGIKLRRLDAGSGMPSADDTTLYDLARRPAPPHAIEAPYLIWRAPYYYLFVSFDACCQGANSTYNVRVGRSEAVTGPYLDRAGVPMLDGGGTLLVSGEGRWRGPGHEAVVRAGDVDLLVYHAYDAEVGGWPTLRIRPLTWVDGWPVANGPGGTPGEP